MQPQETRCPKCGKLKSAVWINPAANAAAAAPATCVLTTATAGPPSYIPYANPAAATAPAGQWFTYNSSDYCWCGVSLR